jgi:hypothetical protein
MTTPVTIKDFQPVNTWESEPGTPYLLDMTTGNRYWNEPKGVVGTKAFLLALGTPIVHAIALTIQVFASALKLITLWHFWGHTGEKETLKEKLLHAGADFLKIAAAPLALAGLELSAIYGIFRPYDGRKLYASFERAEYGHYVLAPCFQPNPERHLLNVSVGGSTW